MDIPVFVPDNVDLKPEGEPAWGQRFYRDDGPGDRPLKQLDQIPDAVPVDEPLNRFTSQPYTVFGRTYTPMTQANGFSQKGIASWYGRRFHGKRTSSGEPYDMYGMTGAHPTLPIPSYVRVTNVANGRSVVVRINDRGPFHPGRVLDLSYAAAHRLGYAARGSAEVLVEALQPGDGSPPLAAAEATLADAGARSAAPLARAEPIPAQIDDGGAARLEPATARPPRNEPVDDGQWLQLGAFAKRDNAEAFRQTVGTRHPELGAGLVVVDLDGKWRVRLGPIADREALSALRATLKQTIGVSAVPVKP
ncbi:MAG: septal ring lytic transglycosylase RlpA family protein [Rhodocyclaceae bacterium]|nr:septal ring lytic transglycosylase RlpA family protein [Rhodocyclaceae bacterium]